jgi:electron transfer flavoprotein beta subunit
MKAIVAVKRVVDYAVKVRLTSAGSVDLNVKMSMNPFCEIAVEEAVRLKEKGFLSEIVAVSIGPTQCQETLRQALAMGADRAILVAIDARPDTGLQPLNVAKILQKIVEKEDPLLVLMGKQSIDGDHNQTGQILGGLLSWPQATFASAITFSEARSNLLVSREVDAGIERVSLKLPAVVTTDLRLNTPRFVTLPNLMKAKKKPIDVIDLPTLGVDFASRSKVLKLEEPPKRKGGKTVSSVDELINLLRTEAKVI